MRKLTAIGIARRNARWTAAGPEAKRVLLAKDVKASISAGRLIAKSGYYFEPSSYRPGDTDLNANQCAGCAIGSLVIEACRLNHFVKPSDFRYAGQTTLYGALGDLFPPEQCSLMESAFERRVVHNGRTLHPGGPELEIGEQTSNNLDLSEQGFAKYPAWRNAVEFGKQYKNDKDRLSAIMDNVAANGGVFHPYVPKKDE